MKRWLPLLVYIIVLAAIVHVAVVFAAPYAATDRVIAGIATTRLGLTPNALGQPRITSAPRDVVPMSNTDTVTTSSWLDLRQGPLVFEADVPTHAVYWSISIFAHDSDTDFVLSDRELGEHGHARVLILGPGQEAPAGYEDARVARISTQRAFLLVRSIMRDRNDPADVEALTSEVGQATLQPAS
jgi:hypothetical protein